VENNSSGFAGAVFLLDLKSAGHTLLLTVGAQLRAAADHSLALGLAAGTEGARLFQLAHVVGVLKRAHWNEEVVDLGNRHVVCLRIKDVVVLSSEHHVVLISASVGVLRDDQVLRRGDVGSTG
jgi:hypothetical protein